MKSKLIDQKTTKQIKIDVGLHRLLKIESAKSGKTLRELVEGSIVELIGEISKQNEI